MIITGRCVWSGLEPAVIKCISISLSAVAQKEEEDLRKLKEENRPGPIQLAPERLGNVEIKYMEVLIWKKRHKAKERNI